MLRYFRINDPYRLLGLLLILVILYLPQFLNTTTLTLPELKAMLVGEKLHENKQLYVEVIDNTGPFSAWIHNLMTFLFDRSLLARHIFAFIIIFLQSAYIGIIFITKKAFNENTFIPSFIFSVLYFFSFDTLTLTDELLGSTFLLFALSNVFEEMEFRTSRDETVFNLGLYISIASLFYLPYVIFLFAVLTILFLFARTTPRKILLLVFGFLLPHLLMLSISFLNDASGNMWEYYYLSNLTYYGDMLVSWKGLIILGLIPSIYFVVSVVMLNRQARFSKYQTQLLQSVFLWIGFCFIYFMFCPTLRPQTLIVLIPALSFLFTNFLLLIRRKRLAEINTWVFLTGIASISYLSHYGVLSSVDYGKMLVESKSSYKEKKILALDPDPGYYVNNQAGSSFINWKLAQPILSSPEYYESIISVSKGIKSDPPQIIIDPSDLMEPFMKVIPDVKMLYRREGNTYIRK